MRERIDYHQFLTWLKQHFPVPREKNGKIRINSMFCEHLGGDKKFRLYCKPSIGYFKCMKSGAKGRLYDLVMQLEKCSYSEAVDILGGKQDLRYFEDKLSRYLNPEEIIAVEEEKPVLEMPPNSFLIVSLSESNHYRIRAEEYLKGRKLQPKGLWICVGGEYANRIVIPYYDRQGTLIYWNARDLGNSYLRYRGPDGSLGAKREEVVWMEFFPKSGTQVFLTEGEFDAMALNECGFHAAATGGAGFNPKQLDMLRGYQLVLSYDADKAGEQGLMSLVDAAKQTPQSSSDVGGGMLYVRPPKQFKDWNAMLQAYDKDIVRLYINKKTKEHVILNSWNILRLKNEKIPPP